MAATLIKRVSLWIEIRKNYDADEHECKFSFILSALQTTNTHDFREAMEKG